MRHYIICFFEIRYKTLRDFCGKLFSLLERRLTSIGRYGFTTYAIGPPFAITSSFSFAISSENTLLSILSLTEIILIPL